MMAALERLGGESWFLLGDRDLATHIERTRRLAAGETLSGVTRDFATRLGVRQTILPMSDDRVRTLVETDAGLLAFQDYFVRLHCAPRLTGLRFDGAATARPLQALLAALAAPDLEAVIICPSNPFLSLGPMLAMPALTEALRRSRAPVVAVSPIIGGKAVKGPAAKIMAELGMTPSAAAVARHYGALLDGFMLDCVDAVEADACRVPTCVTDIMMHTRPDRARLAQTVIDFAGTLRQGG